MELAPFFLGARMEAFFVGSMQLAWEFEGAINRDRVLRVMTCWSCHKFEAP